MKKKHEWDYNPDTHEDSRSTIIGVVILSIIAFAFFGFLGVMYFIGGVKMVSSWFN
jgi:hypothetical protein